MNRDYIKKIETIKKLRSFFDTEGAVEVFTPVLRKTSCAPISRIQTENGLYLRNCQEMQLRLMTGYYDNVFEIGPSFRKEEEDSTHGVEFTLCEAIFKGKKLEYLKNLIKKLFDEFGKGYTCDEISVSNEIKRITGIDIIASGEQVLVEYLKNRYPGYIFQQNFHLVNHFIHEEIEPLSRNKCVFFVDYPSCTLSLARYSDCSKEIVNRFEFFVDGLEISNGYEIAPSIEEFITRNAKVDMFTPEEQYLATCLSVGSIPLDAAIIGIGIERLCMSVFDIHDIRLLLHENNVF